MLPFRWKAHAPGKAVRPQWRTPKTLGPGSGGPTVLGAVGPTGVRLRGVAGCLRRWGCGGDRRPNSAGSSAQGASVPPPESTGISCVREHPEHCEHRWYQRARAMAPAQSRTPRPCNTTGKKILGRWGPPQAGGPILQQVGGPHPPARHPLSSAPARVPARPRVRPLDATARPLGCPSHCPLPVRRTPTLASDRRTDRGAVRPSTRRGRAMRGHDEERERQRKARRVRVGAPTWVTGTAGNTCR